MATLIVNGAYFDVEPGSRLVLDIEENGVRIGHRCGGKGECTTCRVKFFEGEPEVMTMAEFERLHLEGLYGQVRLSCQIEVDHTMSVKPLMTAENQPEWNGDTGPEPDEIVEPEAIWYPKKLLEEEFEQSGGE